MRLLSSPRSRFDVRGSIPADRCCKFVSGSSYAARVAFTCVLTLVGPTATGKSDLGLGVASALGAEVICADAMTIWRGLDIGTAKPTLGQQARIRHHLLDLFEPGSRPTVANIAAEAVRVLPEIQARGALPLVVGGSGLYVRAIVDGLEFPPTDADLRAELEALPLDEAVRRLRALDPASFEYLDAANRRRVVRALEITLLTGTPVSQQRAAWSRRADVPIVGLDLPDDLLVARIAARTASMLAAGWIDECRAFDEAGRRDEVLSTQALGYREIFQVIDGAIEASEAEAQISRATLKLAKRQRTWFRADARVHWLDATDPAEAARQAERYFATQRASQRHT